MHCIYHHLNKHLLANVRGYVPEQILVAERMLGRLLIKGEIVHHRNRRKIDNNPTNLLVFKNRSEHAKFHLAERIRNKEGQFRN